MKTSTKIFLFTALIMQFTFLSTSFVSAKCMCNDGEAPLVKAPGDCTAQGCHWEEDASASNVGTAPTVDIPNPLKANSVPELISNVIKVALGIVGSLALLMFVYGGFTWMLAAGNESAIEKGKNILTWATIGLVVIFASYSLVDFIIKSVAK